MQGRSTSRARRAALAGGVAALGALAAGLGLLGRGGARRAESARGALAIERSDDRPWDELVGEEQEPSEGAQHASALGAARSLGAQQAQTVALLAARFADAQADAAELEAMRAALARNLGPDARDALLLHGADAEADKEQRLAALALAAELTRGEPPVLAPTALELLRRRFSAAAYAARPSASDALVAHALGRLGGAPGEALLLEVLEGSRSPEETTLALAGLGSSQRGELCYELAFRSARSAEESGARPWLAALAQQVRAAGEELDPSARAEAARVARGSLTRAAEPGTARTALALLAAADPEAGEAFALAELDTDATQAPGAELVELALGANTSPERLAERLRGGSSEARARAAEALLRSDGRARAGAGALAEAQALLVRRAREAASGLERRRALAALADGADERARPWLEELAREARAGEERAAARRALDALAARAR